MFTATVYASDDRRQAQVRPVRAPRPAYLRYCKRRSVTNRAFIRVRRCRTCNGSPGPASRCTRETCPAIQLQRVVCGCRWILQPIYTRSRPSEQRSLLLTTIPLQEKRSNQVSYFLPKPARRPEGLKWTPEKAPKGPVSIVISGGDRVAYVYRNGVEIGRSPVSGIERLSGSYVFTALQSLDPSGRREWISTASSGRRAPNLKDLAKRFRVSAAFDDDIQSLITPGTTLVITNLPSIPAPIAHRALIS